MKLKRLLCSIFIIIMVFSTGLVANAKSTDNSFKNQQQNEQGEDNNCQGNSNFMNQSSVFDVIEDFGDVSPRSTWFGNSGSARLTYVPGARAFNWGINVPSATPPLIFAGRVDIHTQSTGALRGTVFLSGIGINSVSGQTSIPGNITLQRNVNYEARFSGTANDFLHRRYLVVPGAKITFRLQ